MPSGHFSRATFGIPCAPGTLARSGAVGSFRLCAGSLAFRTLCLGSCGHLLRVRVLGVTHLERPASARRQACSPTRFLIRELDALFAIAVERGFHGFLHRLEEDVRE